jgi:hypothetical protein
MGRLLAGRRARAAVLAGASTIFSAGFLVTAQPAFATGPVNITVPCNEAALESAINTANASSTGGMLALNGKCTYTLADSDNLASSGDFNGLPVVTNLITIWGHGATIKRSASAPVFRIFEVGSTGNLVINNLTVSGGNATAGGGIYVDDAGILGVNNSQVTHNTAASGSSPSSGGAGGGISVAPGSGFDLGGNVTITNSQVAYNTAVSDAPNGNGASFGGGIFNLGVTTMVSSQVHDNLATCNGIGCFPQGGAIWTGYPCGTFTIQGSTAYKNTASCAADSCSPSGGAIWSSDRLNLGNSTLYSNTAYCTGASCNPQGGAVYTYGQTVFTNTPVRSNLASCTGSGCMSQGGGINNSGTGFLTLVGSPLTSNTALAPGQTAQGGGLYNFPCCNAVQVLAGSDITNNSASAVGGSPSGGGIYNANTPPQTVALSASEVEDNHPDQCNGPGTPIPGC